MNFHCPPVCGALVIPPAHPPSRPPQRLVSASVAGVVGPACSEAVLGANPVFQANQIPFVSFAATADEFGGRSFDTLFRTV